LRKEAVGKGAGRSAFLHVAERTLLKGERVGVGASTTTNRIGKNYLRISGRGKAFYDKLGKLDMFPVKKLHGKEISKRGDAREKTHRGTAKTGHLKDFYCE